MFLINYSLDVGNGLSPRMGQDILIEPSGDVKKAKEKYRKYLSTIIPDWQKIISIEISALS